MTASWGESTDAARMAAAELLRQVQEDDAYANLALPGVLASFKLQAREAAFATELAYGTLRWQGLYDAVLQACITGDPQRVEPSTRILLRMGCHQVLGMRVPVHASVSSTVALAKGRSARAEARAGFVNGVLRAVCRHGLDEWLRRLDLQPAVRTDQLAIRWSHPAWIVRAFADALGPRRDELPDLLSADNLAARPALVARPGRISVEELLDQPGVVPGRWSPLGGILSSGTPQALACVRSGDVGVQDEGSQLVALALARAPISSSAGTWLDACAGPGGKAALLAGLASQQGAQLVAVEARAHRARLVRAVLPEEGVEVIEGDARTSPWGDRRFDRVLVDAPCTGIGALRRRPEARWRRSASDLVTLGPLQRDLLRAGMQATAPGGVLAYVTCSPHLAETEAVVQDLLGREHRWSMLEAPSLLPEVPDSACGSFVQLWPHRHGTDAMFLAVLLRR